MHGAVGKGSRGSVLPPVRSPLPSRAVGLSQGKELVSQLPAQEKDWLKRFPEGTRHSSWCCHLTYCVQIIYSFDNSVLILKHSFTGVLEAGWCSPGSQLLCGRDGVSICLDSGCGMGVSSMSTVTMKSSTSAARVISAP